MLIVSKYHRDNYRTSRKDTFYRSNSFSDNPDHINPSAIAEQAFREMDLDNDNKITCSEFVISCLKNTHISSMLASKVLGYVSSDCGSS